jgi:hypothetical protein
MENDFEWEVRHPSVPYYVHIAGTTLTLFSWLIRRHQRASIHVAF